MECRTTERTMTTMWTAKCSLKSRTTSGIRLTSSTRRRNLVYVNTGRTKKDGTTDEKTHERKLKWDEENRLLASDDDGFVTNYWYDADGERTVKTSGESEQVYVNSEFAGGRTNTAKFSLYVSPYLVANQGGRYTKHIYIGSQRIVSKIGDFASYGADPRRIQYAGKEADAVNVDYDVKYSQQLQAIKENYATFGVPYNGTDNDDYVDGEGFCCDDGTIEASMAQANAPEDNFQEGDAYEDLQFYYHTDHLGSSSYITNLDGEVVQHIEYVPFGEVFIEERNNIWNTPYLFNAKEFDEETGLYYYGARYYDPRLSLWMSTDPSKEKYPNISAYVYCHNNPIILFDIDGKDDYKIDEFGHIYFWRKSNAKSTHRIYSGTSNITVNRDLVEQLVSNQKSQGTYATTSNADDAFKFFKFAADQTKVEWILTGIKTNSGVSFKLNTDFDVESATSDASNYKSMFFHLHNHPWGTNVSGTKASGSYREYQKISSGQKVSGHYNKGDIWMLNNIYNAYKEANPNLEFSKYPKAYIYYAGDKKQESQLYQYDLMHSKLDPVYNPNYKQIKLRIYKK